MGTCQSQKQNKNCTNQINQINLSAQFPKLKDQIHFFDQISLEQLNQPDLSAFISKHLNKNRIVNEGKTWIAINEVKYILNTKTTVLIRNFIPETDAAIQLIYLFKQLISLSIEVQELQLDLNEYAIELFHHFQVQLVQVSIEILLAVNTLMKKQEHWWNDNYFNWRKNYIQSIFKIKQPDVEKVEFIHPFFEYIALLKECAKQLCNKLKSPDLIAIDIKAQQEVLEQFYNQLRNGFLQNQLYQADSINWEHHKASKQLEQRLQTYTLYIRKKNSIS